MMVLGLLVAPGIPEGVPRFLSVLRRWCLPRWAHPNEQVEAPPAWFATSPGASFISDVISKKDGRIAVWVETTQEWDEHEPILEQVDVVASSDVRVVRAAATRGVLVPALGVDLSHAYPITPFVRSNWRRRVGLSSEFVVSTEPNYSPVPPDLLPTALALASAVIARGNALPEAMAWGAPCVTDAESLSAAEGEDGRHAVVASAGDFVQRAHDLSEEPRLAALIGREGRRLVEERHDLSRAGAELAQRLGIRPNGSRYPDASIAARLAELWTPPDSRIVDRAAAACVPLLE